MIFSICGLLIGERGLTVLNLESHLNIIEVLAELTLMLVLFSDASQVSFKYLDKYKKYPIRLLFIGLPLCIVFGVLAGIPILKDLSLWEIALVAAILTPTDAALGKFLITSKAIPRRIRDSINVESGLNDGIALPFVLLFGFMAQKSSANMETSVLLTFILKQLVLGPLAGYIIGKYGAKLINFSADKKLISPGLDGIYALSLAAISFSVAKFIGGNSFIAVYFTGLVFGNYVIKPNKFLMEFTESEGQILTLATFIFFGALLPMSLNDIQISWVLYALLSLTVVRMIPIAISVIGTEAKPVNVWLVGWFGPRGVASILYLVMIKSTYQIENMFLIAQVVMLTIFLSIFLHGLSAIPIVKYYPKED
jgi:NhaP-type Na+/H+ or K+/H+ antiporter